MKTITLVACSRLHYLVQTVECLKRNKVDGYTLFLGVEPVDQTVIEYCRKLDFMPVHLTVNPARLGVAWNPRATIGRAFESGSEFNVAIEDDLLLSPDALDLASWFWGLDDPRHFSLNFCNYHSDPSFPSEVEESSHFIPLGWAMTRAVWQTLIKPNWMCDARGWDFSVNKVLESHATRKILQPKLARSNHNGRDGGEHCSAEFHDRTFGHLRMSDGTRRDYHIVGVKHQSPNQTRQEVRIAPGSFAGMHPDEVVALREELAGVPGIGVEIGCMDGFSSCIILAASNLRLTSIDPLVPDSMDPSLIGCERNLMANMAPWGERFRFLKDYSENVSKIWSDPIDFLFIDGDHNYNAVLLDFLQWTRFLRKGGLLAMHDARMNRAGGATFHPGSSKVADEFLFTYTGEWRVIREAHSLVMAVRL